jgi:Integrase core domain
MKELRVLAERWRVHYNTVRPYSSLRYRPPAPEAWLTSTTRQQGEPVASLPPYPCCHTLHRSELRGRCATLTPHWYKTSGNPLIGIEGPDSEHDRTQDGILDDDLYHTARDPRPYQLELHPANAGSLLESNALLTASATIRWPPAFMCWFVM